jgi:hypothetical protein
MLTLLTAAAFAQDCPQDGLELIRDATDRLWEAYARVNIKEFDEASVEINNGIHCVRTRLDSHAIVELHRTMAIIAFAAGQQSPSRKSWLAARTLDPSWDLPRDLYPENHPVRVLFEEAAPTAAPKLENLQSDGVEWLVDGIPASVVPLDRAFVLQALDDDGAVRYTGYLWSIIDIPSLNVGEERGLHTAVLRVGAQVFGGALFASQVPGDGASGFLERSDTAPVAGADVRARVSPLRFAAADLSLAGLLNTDAAAGGGTGSEARGALILGWELRETGRRIRFGVRGGLARQSLVGWSGDLAAPTSQRFAAPLWSIGADVALATEADRFGVALGPDFLLGGGAWQLRAEGDWSHRVNDWAALEVTALGAPPLRGYELLDAESGAVVAERRDAAIRLSVGLSVYR